MGLILYISVGPTSLFKLFPSNNHIFKIHMYINSITGLIFSSKKSPLHLIARTFHRNSQQHVEQPPLRSPFHHLLLSLSGLLGTCQVSLFALEQMCHVGSRGPTGLFVPPRTVVLSLPRAPPWAPLLRPQPDYQQLARLVSRLCSPSGSSNRSGLWAYTL